MRFRRSLLWSATVVLTAWLGFMLLVRPSTDRSWKEDHARLPTAAFDGSTVAIADIRNFVEGPDNVVDAAFYDATFDLRALGELWLVVSVFDEESRRGPAHAMLSFGFDDGRYLVISVEARKEHGESYSIWKGLFRRYELIYVVGDERDLIRTRAVHRPDDVYLYPIKAPRAGIQDLFVDLLETANQLRTQPRFYNTLTGNCTTKLADHVNAVAPGTIPPSWKLILPGYVDELVQGLDLLVETEDIATVRRRYWINERARAAQNATGFSRLIREGLGQLPTAGGSTR